MICTAEIVYLYRMRAPDHLNALRAFEAAARHLSFALAAEELSVTPAAVGQLVRRLEDVLGVELFHRFQAGPARLVLTEAAKAALPDLRAGFGHLSAAMDWLHSARERRTLAVTVPSAFADKWLLHRLEGFGRVRPDYALRIDTRTGLADFAAEAIDVGIRYGAGVWPGLTARYLARDRFFPVCSPALLEGQHPLAAPEGLRRHQLIHDTSMGSVAEFPTWRDWHARAGLPVVESERGLHVDDSAAALRMAMAGNGVALGRSMLVAEDLAEGRLVSPFGPALDCSLAYYVVCRSGDADDPAIAAFRDWVLEEAGSDGHSAAGAARSRPAS
ncbi:transcriptional regulator GcvA [Roseomonas populi]|uniref:Transcriptional regulator GcvA n=1 Tax=Roseomonas populi TaxID=3121582 RepID=A0ABT1X9I0_9PROT|nr:transcriptional regulator GcvA [Roseomonas pecuniae]MCR0983792.1 transcriptional regulator GcvA [Roseomonas pecuniae]